MIVMITVFKGKTTVFVLIAIFESSFYRKMLKKVVTHLFQRENRWWLIHEKSGSIMIIQKYLFWLLGFDSFKFV